MFNLMVILTFSFSNQKYHIWANLNLSCLFTMKFGVHTNSNMLNVMLMFTCPVLKWKYSFWANLAQMIKIVYLRQNLILRLI